MVCLTSLPLVPEVSPLALPSRLRAPQGCPPRRRCLRKAQHHRVGPIVLPPLVHNHDDSAPVFVQHPVAASEIESHGSPDSQSLAGCARQILHVTSSSAWMLAHDIRVPAILRGDFEEVVSARQEAAFRRARCWRSLCRSKSVEAREHAQSWRRRMRAVEEEFQKRLPEEAEMEHAENEARPTSELPEETEAVKTVDTGLRRGGGPKKSKRIRRLNRARARAQHHERALQADLDLAVPSKEARRELEVLYKQFAGRQRSSGADHGLDAHSLPGCLAALGLAGTEHKEREAVRLVCEEELGDGPVNMCRLGVRVLPRAREALAEVQRTRVVQCFNQHMQAFGAGQGGRLYAAQCVVALDCALAGEVMGEATDKVKRQLWQAIEPQLDYMVGEEGADLATFSKMAHASMEVAAKLLHKSALDILEAHDRCGDCANTSNSARVCGSVSSGSGGGGLLRPSLLLLNGYDGACAPAKPLQQDELMVFDWFFRHQRDNIADGTGRLSEDDLQAMLTQLGLLPVGRGPQAELQTMDSIALESLEEAMKQEKQRAKVSSEGGNADGFCFSGCFAIMSAIRAGSQSRVAVILRKRLGLDPTLEEFGTAGGSASGSGAQLQTAWSVNQVLALLQVVPRTAMERDAIDGELRAVGGHTGKDLPIVDLASFAARAMERLRRLRRSLEWRAAEALELESELHIFREVFAEEAARAASQMHGAVALRNLKQELANGASRASPARVACCSTRHAHSASSGLGSRSSVGGASAPGGDGEHLSIDALQEAMVRAGHQVSPELAAHLAAVVAGLPKEAGDTERCGGVEVDLAGALLALRLVRDCSDLVDGHKAAIGDAEEEGNGRRGSRKNIFACLSCTVTGGRPLSSSHIRVVLAALGIGGPLTLSLPQSDQEALARDAVNTVTETVSPGLDTLRVQTLPELVRRARAWAVERCGI